MSKYWGYFTMINKKKSKSIESTKFLRKNLGK